MKKIRNVIICLIIVILCGCFNTKKEEKINISTIDNLNIEINSEVKLSSLINNSDEIDLVNSDDLIDTSKLGEKEVVLKYYDKAQNEKFYSFKVNIVDTTAPTIECQDKIITNIGKQVDLLKSATVKDNSNEKINLTIEGEYNYDKSGTYNLKFVAKDSSGNETKKDFILVVNAYTLKNTGYYVYKQKDAWVGLSFEKNGKASWFPWWCPGSACGGGGVMFGKYVINGNTIIATFTETYEDTGEKSEINEVYKYTLTNDNTIVDENNNKYNWQKKFIN